MQLAHTGGHALCVSEEVSLEGFTVGGAGLAGDLAFHQDLVVTLGGGVEGVLDAEGCLGGMQAHHRYRCDHGGLGFCLLGLCAHLGDVGLQVLDGVQDLGLSFRSLCGLGVHSELSSYGSEGVGQGGVGLGFLLGSLEVVLIGLEGALAVTLVVLCDDVLLFLLGEALLCELSLQAERDGYGFQVGNEFVHSAFKCLRC